MLKKLMLIINPMAGRGAYKSNFAEAMQVLTQGGYTVTLYYTVERGDARRFAAQYAREYDAVACIGGDGTLSEMLAGLMQLDNPPPVGYFPMGTANDVATTLGLPKNDTVQAARRILSGTPHPFDVGRFGEKDYFSYIAAFGAFTEVSYATPQDQKKMLGHLAYVLQGMQQLPKIETIHTHVEYDGGVFDGDLLYGSVSNSTSVAGIVHLPETMVSLGDGVSELVLVRDPGSVAAFAEIVSSVLSERFDSENLLILHTRKARFQFEKPIAWTRDGEAGGEVTDITIENIKCPVQLIF
jgi:lipid kinase, YegS/Rv2252/BmrU family